MATLHQLLPFRALMLIRGLTDTIFAYVASTKIPSLLCATAVYEIQMKMNPSMGYVHLTFLTLEFSSQGELEKLNQSTDDINRCETELEV